MYVQPHVQPHVRHEDNPIYKQEYTVELYIKSPVVVLGIISSTSNRLWASVYASKSDLVYATYSYATPLYC